MIYQNAILVKMGEPFLRASAEKEHGNKKCAPVTGEKLPLKKREQYDIIGNNRTCVQK